MAKELSMFDKVFIAFGDCSPGGYFNQTTKKLEILKSNVDMNNLPEIDLEIDYVDVYACDRN